MPYRIGPRRSGRGSLGEGGDEYLVDVDAVHRFAREFREQHKGKWQEAERLGGFCLLLKRGVLARVGPPERWSDLGLFDTDLLSAKARQAGFTLALCRDLFVHHFGTRTFVHGAPAPDRAETNGTGSPRPGALARRNEP